MTEPRRNIFIRFTLSMSQIALESGYRGERGLSIVRDRGVDTGKLVANIISYGFIGCWLAHIFTGLDVLYDILVAIVGIGAIVPSSPISVGSYLGDVDISPNSMTLALLLLYVLAQMLMIDRTAYKVYLDILLFLALARTSIHLFHQIKEYGSSYKSKQF